MGLILLLKRLVAFMVDWIILFTIFALPQFVIAIVAGRWVLSYGSPPLEIWGWITLTVSIPILTYFALLDSSVSCATFGKRMFRLSVRNVAGRRIGRLRALLRATIKLLPWEMAHIMIFFPEPFGDTLGTTKIILMIVTNALLIIWIAIPLLNRAVYRALHDMAAGTRVVQYRGPHSSFRTT